MRRLPLVEPKQHPLMDDKLHQLNLFNIRNVIYWNYFFELVQHVTGDIVECGIGRSRSLLIISALNHLYTEKEGGNRDIFAYDSFEGFPEPTNEDVSYRQPQKGDWSFSPSGKYKYSIEFTLEILLNAGIEINQDKIKIIKGFFNDSLPNHPERPIAILHVDGDLYSSYIDTLTNLYDKVTKGGVIVFDDFFEDNLGEDRWPGARKAVKEFLGIEYSDLKVSNRGSYYYIKQ